MIGGLIRRFLSILFCFKSNGYQTNNQILNAAALTPSLVLELGINLRRDVNVQRIDLLSHITSKTKRLDHKIEPLKNRFETNALLASARCRCLRRRPTSHRQGTIQFQRELRASGQNCRMMLDEPMRGSRTCSDGTAYEKTHRASR